MRNFFEPAAASPPWLRQVLSSIRAALGDIWPGPLRLKDYEAAALPAAAEFAQGLVYEATAGRIAYSDGAGWTQLQDYDATLAGLAALDGSAGILVQIAADSFAKRVLAAPAAGLTIANPAGIAGNPTFALANDLAALEALSGTNTLYYRSGADAWSAVAIGANLSFAGGILNTSANPAFATVSTSGSATLGDATGDSHVANGIFNIVSANATGSSDTSYGLRLLVGSSPGLTLGMDASNAYIQSWGSRTLQVNQQGNIVDFGGNLYLQGFFFAAHSGSYNLLCNPSGDASIYMGGSGDPANYYDNNNHYFRSAAGASSYGYLNASGLNLSTGASFVTGDVAVGSGGIVAIRGTSTAATNKGASLAFGGNMTSANAFMAEIAGRWEGSGDRAYLQLATNGPGGLIERARIDSNGNLLIANTGGAPGTPSGGGYLYVESGALKFRGGSGTVTVIAAA